MSERVEDTNIIVSPALIKDTQGNFQVTVINGDSQPNTYQLSAEDKEGLCTEHFDAETLTIEGGSRKTVTLDVRFKNRFPAFTARTCRFNVRAVKTNGDTLTASGELERPALPKWGIVAGGLAAVAIIVLAVVLSNLGNSAMNAPSSPEPSVTATPSAQATASMDSSVTPSPAPAESAATPTTAVTTTTAATPTQAATPTPSASATSPATTTLSPTEPASTPVPTTQPEPGPAATTPDLNGVWRFEVTNVTSSCGPESSWFSTVTFVQNGSTLETTGIKDTSYVIPGSMDGMEITIGPNSFPEDGGTTTTTYILTVLSDTTIQGREEWTWADSTSSCSGGTGTVVMTKLE